MCVYAYAMPAMRVLVWHTVCVVVAAAVVCVRVFSVEFSFPKELTFHNCQKKNTEYREPSDTNKKMAKMKFFIR